MNLQDTQKQQSINIPQINTQQQKNIFDDPLSPFNTSHDKVKLLLTSCSKNGQPDYQNINFSILGFQIKKTQSNFCTYYFAVNQQCNKLYDIGKSCQQCSLTINVIYCPGCFEQQKHVGHKIERRPTQSNYAYCDCGRIQRLKPGSFCKNHTNFDNIISYPISQQQKVYFGNIVCQLLDCSIYQKYLGHKNIILLAKIVQFLQKLNLNSVYYNRLTMQILIKKSQYWNSIQKNQQISQYLMFIFLSYPKCILKLVFHTFGDLQTRITFIEFIHSFQIHKQKQFITQCIGRIDFTELFNHVTTLALSNSGLTSKFIQRSFRANLPSPSPKCQKLYLKHYQNLVKLANNLLDTIDLIQVDTTKFPSSIKKNLLFKLLQLYPQRKQLEKYLPNHQKQQNPNLLFQLFRSASYPPNLKNINDIILKIMVQAQIQQDINHLKNLRQYLFDNGVSQENLQTYIEFMLPQLCHSIYFIKKEQIGQNYPHYIVYFLCLLKGSPKQPQLIQKMWTTLFQSHNPQILEQRDKRKKLSFTQLGTFVDILNFLASCIIHIDLLLMLKKKIKLYPDKNQIIQQKLSNWFKSYLYEMKSITKQQLLYMKDNHITTDHFIKIVNQLCIYSYQYAAFIYISQNKYPNVANQLQFMPKKGNFAVIYNCQLRFGDKITLQSDSLANHILQMTFKNKIIVKLFDSQWLKYKKSIVFNDNQYRYTYLYFFALILLDILTNGSNKQLHDKLTSLTSDWNSLLQFSINTQQQLQLLQRLFNFDKQNQPIKQQLNIENSMQQQSKNILIKQNNKIQTNNGNFKQPIKNCKKQHICVSCKKQSNNQSQLAYVVGINKDHTVSSMLYGQNNASRTYLETCLHPIHIHCFSRIRFNELKKRVNCPSCQKLCNCLIPITYDKNNQQFNSACFNSMIYSSIQSAHFYDLDNLFILIFKHFVQSYGLRQFTPKAYALHTPLIQQSNKFLLNYAQQIYFTSSEQQKNKYNNEIDQFIEQIKKVKLHSYQIIQLLFVNYVKGMIINKKAQIDYKLLYQLMTMLSDKQFSTLKTNISKLTSQPIALDESMKCEVDNSKKKQNQLMLGFIQLPQFPHILFEIANQLHCRCSAQKRATGMCLFCGAGLCSVCSEKHNQEIHHSVSLYFVFSNFMVFCNLTSIQNSNVFWSVYQSQFKVPINQGAKDLSTFDVNAYTLNQKLYSYIVQQHLENY